MQEQKQFPEPVEALLLVLAVFAISILSIFSLSLLNQSDLSKPETIIENARYYYIFGGSLFLIIPFFYARFRHYPIRSVFRFNPVPGSVALLSIPIGLALTVLSDELDRLLGFIITVPQWVYDMMYPLKAETTSDWALILTGAVIIAAVAEEVLFRGFLQISLERKGDVTRAVLLSALAWTLVHQNPYWAVEIFIMGIFMGFLAWRTNSIIPPVIVHALNNFIAVWMLNVNLEESMQWYEWNGHVSPAVLIIAIVVLVWGLRRISAPYQEASEQEYH